MPVDNLEKKSILGVDVNFDLTMDSVIALIDSRLQTPGSECSLISTINPEFVVDAQEDDEFKRVLNSSFLGVVDGIGLLYAHNFLERSKTVKENPFKFIRLFLKGVNVIFKRRDLGVRISGVDLVDRMCALAAEKNYSVFLLGGWEKDNKGKMRKFHGNVALKAANKLKEKYPKLKIIGATSEFSYKAEDDASTIAFIKESMRKHSCSSIDMLFVAYNHSNQEKWIARNGSRLPAKLGVGVGGTFDYISGNARRPGDLAVTLHIEWLVRLFQCPWRYKRILKAFPLFPWLVYRSALQIGE
jgi:N-acetylglucosaminyldiphosphoundecaprenol N-acetyl-beta-D-mannosaminyltransferase